MSLVNNFLLLLMLLGLNIVSFLSSGCGSSGDF